MKIKFMPQGLEVQGDPNKSLLQIATENKLEIRSICKGVPSCAECRVMIPEGQENVIPPSKAELNLIGTSWYIDGRRLSCQVRCFGDVTVDLSEQIGKEDNSNKKLRGFKTSKHQESHAVLDTLVLSEKSPAAGDSDDSDSDTNEAESATSESSPKSEHNKSQRRQAGSQDSNRGQGQHRQHQGQQQGKRSQPQQGGQKNKNHPQGGSQGGSGKSKNPQQPNRNRPR